MAVKPVYPSKRKANNSKKTVKSRKKAVAHKATYKNTRRPQAKKRAPIGVGGFLKNVFRQREGAGEFDYTFLLLVAVLTIFGLVMLLSASTPTASVKFKTSYYFFIRQFVFVAIGFALMFVFANIDYKRFKPYVNLFYVICGVLLFLVFLPIIGVSLNGSRRWINLGFMNFQPSELAKLSVAMFYALMIEEKRYDLRDTKDLARSAIWVGIIAVLMLAETHLSGTIVICSIALCLMIVGGARMSVVGLSLCSVGIVGWVAIKFLDPVRWARMVSFVNPFADKQGSGYQTIQSLYAIGSGGIFGKGLGQSVQKFSYLPEPYNDFIFSIVCEELGLLGAGFIIALFAGLIIRGIKIGMEAPDKFGLLTVVGIMTQIGVQTILNIAVTTSTVPNTGVSLPFFSYGGTAVMILLAQMGIVLNVSRYSTKNLS